MKINKSKLYSCYILFLFLFCSCRKAELRVSNPISQPDESVQTFLRLPKDADPILVRITEELKKQDELHPFITNLIKEAGMPRWDYSELKAISSSTLNTITNYSSPSTKKYGENKQSLNDTTILVPLIYNSTKYVNSFLAFHISDSIRFDLIKGKDYYRYGYDESTNKPTAKKIAMRCMLFDHKIFNTDTFRVTDKKSYTISSS